MNTHPLPPLDRFTTNHGESLAELSNQTPVLVVFLRHSGCPFCRQTLADLAAKRSLLNEAGVQPVLVHLMPSEEADDLLAKYRLEDVPHIGDPEGKIYEAFGMKPGSFRQVMGPGVWWPGLKATLFQRHFPGRPQGDVFRMPGAFLVHRGAILREFRSNRSSDRVDFERLVDCPACKE